MAERVDDSLFIRVVKDHCFDGVCTFAWKRPTQILIFKHFYCSTMVRSRTTRFEIIVGVIIFDKPHKCSN